MSVSLLWALSPSTAPPAEQQRCHFFPSFSPAQWRTVRARSLERLTEAQAELRMAALHLPLAAL